MRVERETELCAHELSVRLAVEISFTIKAHHILSEKQKDIDTMDEWKAGTSRSLHVLTLD